MMVWKRLPKFAKNSYFLLGLSFFTWISFFDSEDLVTQYQLWRKMNKLQEEKVYYLQQIAIVKKDKQELLTNVALLEKFAREKYYMKKPTEDVYVVCK